MDGSALRASAREYASGVEVGFVDADGVERSGPLTCWWGEPFELASPVRSFASFKGRKNFTGEYWVATSRTQVGYESWVERDAAMALDFDPAVVALASQPFRLTWTDGERERGHTPDYFARLLDGTGVVVDVRPEDLVDEVTAEVFAFTARVCEGVGWQFRHIGDLHQPYRVNLRWLSRYRHGRCHRAPVADRLRKVFAEPLPLLAGAEQVGDRLAVLPVLYHLLWRQELAADLVMDPLGTDTPVHLTSRGRL
ncbi:TnsA-like heteromeric transposase endonuclease subunit [Actinacidiphila oryziradicis]|uniref:TnsA-like heteromeric transposase endonuclease subunit n=1 Tax=Actinacidiphila oryziradicis TaxID=2571141 RepID=A0A4V5N2R7_9ACTN|nr:TnsA-like heteromeric transposase endonuclease subunit [Actinacidiphila oryziradicis]TKA10959.1 TnsA-like heteromeric transposase endonuclease subunit [Actinacidiphila oryziradicis]